MPRSDERVTVIAGATHGRRQWARPGTAAASRVGQRFSRRRGCGAPICNGRISASPGREVVQSWVGNAAELATYVAEKGKPLLTLAE